MLSAAATCPGTTAASGLTVLVALCGLGIWAGAGYWLYWVAKGYPDNPSGRRLRVGQILQWAAGVCAALMMVCFVLAQAGARCGHTAAVATSFGSWLVLAAVVLAMAGVLLRRDGTGWIAISCVAVGDVGLLPLAVLDLPGSRALAVILSVHGACTAGAAWWARQLRDSPPELRAKASEAGRVLASSWLVLLLLNLAGGIGPGQSGSRSTVLGLFVGAAIALVVGPGYTHYIEAQAQALRDGDEPQPDRASDPVGRLARAARRAAARVSSWRRVLPRRRTGSAGRRPWVGPGR